MGAVESLIDFLNYTSRQREVKGPDLLTGIHICMFSAKKTKVGKQSREASDPHHIKHRSKSGSEGFQLMILCIHAAINGLTIVT